MLTTVNVWPWLLLPIPSNSMYWALIKRKMSILSPIKLNLIFDILQLNLIFSRLKYQVWNHENIVCLQLEKRVYFMPVTAKNIKFKLGNCFSSKEDVFLIFEISLTWSRQIDIFSKDYAQQSTTSPPGFVDINIIPDHKPQN